MSMAAVGNKWDNKVCSRAGGFAAWLWLSLMVRWKAPGGEFNAIGRAAQAGTPLMR